MQQITLNIEEQYLGTFLTLLKTLNYVKVAEKAPVKSLETRAKGFQRIAEDAEMLDLANQGFDDFKKLTNNYETT
jgi:hypothetical protein